MNEEKINITKHALEQFRARYIKANPNAKKDPNRALLLRLLKRSELEKMNAVARVKRTMKYNEDVEYRVTQ